MRPRITAYCLDWHVRHSDALRDILVEPLTPYAEVVLTAWDGESLPAPPVGDRSTIFCMLPPPPAASAHARRLVWLPMWDQARGYDDAWWSRLPSDLRVVALSEEVRKRAVAAGLPTLALRYFKDPAALGPVAWNDRRTLFYWNRTGMVGPEFLRRLCDATATDTLLFRGQIDPRIDPRLSYELPDRLGRTEVRRTSFDDRDSFLTAVGAANLFLAPRVSEGVGMTFLEAMCRGSAVFAFDAPTMNEYIVDGRNGVLFGNAAASMGRRVARAAATYLRMPRFQVDAEQRWDRLAQLDLAGLGKQARADHIAGHRAWVESLPRYAEFVLDAG